MNKKVAATLAGALIGFYGSVPAAWADDVGFDLGGFPSGSGEPFESSGSGQPSAPQGPSGFAAAPAAPAAPALQEEVPSTAPAAASVPPAATRGDDLGLAPDVSAPVAERAPVRAVESTPRTAKMSSLDPDAELARAVDHRRQQQSQPASASASAKRTQAPVRVASGEKKRLIPHLFGAMVSTPGSIVHESISEWRSGVQDMTNGSSNPCVVIPAALISLPFCATAGVVGGINQAMHGADDSAESSTASRPGTSNKKIAGYSKKTPVR